MQRSYEFYIRTTPERLWQAITSSEQRAKFQFGLRAESDWTVGSAYALVAPGSGTPMGDGEIVESDPPRRLVQTMRALWNEDVRAEGSSRITWEIHQIEDSCCLTVTHDQLRDGANKQLYGGWPMILSGLKTWLETGEVLTTPGSQMYLN